MNLYSLNTFKVEENLQINKQIKFLPVYIKLEENYQKLILLENNIAAGYSKRVGSMLDNPVALH